MSAADRAESAERPRPVVLLAAALALVCVAYAPALGGGFVWDDHWLIEGQPLVEELRPVGEYFSRMFWADPLSNEKRDFYRPLVTLSYAVDWRLGGGRPFVFHLTNLLVHLACVALVYALARRAGASAAAAALGAALWGVLPRLTESVAWISGRTDVFATVGVLLALVVWRTEPERWRARAAAGLALCFGLFCKEVAAAGVAGLVAFELAARRGGTVAWSRTARNLLPVAAASGLYAVLRLSAARSEVTFHELGFTRVLLVFDAVARYAGMVLDALRPRLQIGLLVAPSPVLAAAGLALAAVGVVVAVRAWRRGPQPLHAALAASALVALGLVLHVVPLALNVVAADRFLYLPLVAVGVLCALAVDRPRGRPLRVAVSIALVALAAVTWQRSGTWTNELRLWADALAEREPCNGLPEGVAGDVLSDRRVYDRALRHYERAFEVVVRCAKTHGWRNAGDVKTTLLNIGVTLQMLGRYDDAARTFDDLSVRYPGWKKLQYDRVMLELRRLRPDAAERELRAAEATGGADDVSRRLADLVRATREAVAALPPESEGEPLAVAERRARLFDELGAVHDASRAWRRVLASPEAPPALLVRAAGYLAVNGSPADGRAAVDLLVRRVPVDDAVAALVAHVAERETELAAARFP